MPKKPGEASATSVSVPKIPGKMPEMPSSVKTVADVPVLVNKWSMVGTKSQIAQNDSITPKQKFAKDTSAEQEEEDKALTSKVSQADTEKKNVAKQENERKKAVQILHEAEEVTPDEETLFEVNEEPIE